ncbi:outer membrane beta-barrel protein [Pedobacter sp. Hv1]|uniref:type IX secretion/gliding motility protein PorT/SprT n=1 Tax=Pedobacter sp. Hv1 TaxID=1740090 RepID=UPI0006D88A42|nr:outer membrane beta-barrel protein [Pedobacter sp. Hv1]KQC00206.1 porin [Pedobacter sp. Hv1]
MKIKLTLLICLLFVFGATKAQNWGGGIDDDKLSFGFTFQYVAAEYKILKKQNWRQPFIIADPSSATGYRQITDSLTAVSSPVSPGFGIGFVVNSQLNNNLDLRFTPTLVFSDRKMLYAYNKPLMNDASTNEKLKTTKATMIELPIGIKVKSDRLMNFRAYMLGGFKYSIDMASSKKNSNANVTDEMEKNLRNNRSYLSYEAGIGFDLYFEWFKMSPEFKLSYSLKDVVKHEGNAFDSPIEKAKLRHFTFSLFFQ